MCHVSPERVIRQIRTPRHLLYQAERLDCLHRKEPKYDCADCRTLCWHQERLRAQVPHFSGSVAQRLFRGLRCALLRKEPALLGHRGRDRTERGRVDPGVSPGSEYPDSKSRGLAQMGSESSRCTGSAEVDSGGMMLLPQTVGSTVIRNQNHS